MTKIKIYELAKEIGVDSKELLHKAQRFAIDAKTHMSTLNARDADKLRAEFASQGKGTAPAVFVPQVKRIPRVQSAESAPDLPENSPETSVQAPVQASTPSPAPVASAPAAPVAAQPTPAAPAQPVPQPAAPAPQPQPVAEARPAARTEPEPKPQPQPVAQPAAKAQPVAEPAAQAQPQSAAPAPQPPAAATVAAQPQAQPQAAAQPQPTPAEARPAGQNQPRPQNDRPQGDRGPRPQGDRPQGQRPQGDRGPRPQGDRPQGQRPSGDRGPRPQGDRPQGDRPQGQRPYGDRGPRPQGDRPQGDRPQGQRPYGDRGPRPQGDRPQGDRPQGQRPYGDRGPRPQGDRPQGQRPYGDRPQGDRPQGARPQGDRGPRPAGSQQRPAGARPAGDFAPAAEKPATKPTTNYRPNAKKVSVKDMVMERSSESESRGKGFSKPKPGKGGRNMPKGKKEVRPPMPPVTPKKITIGESVTLSELAKSMGRTAGEVIKRLFNMGIMATINQELEADTAILVADEFGITVEVREDKAALILGDADDVDDPATLEERPPVVTIMGHVDHGKTSLLDAIRHTNVVSGEAGGITQHIGAYQVEINGKKITFLDTPGHEAFTAMRARGAQMTDIAIIVVAADDGVMPQTVEAINHSKAAGVPIIIAINKIDKPGADPMRVRTELMSYGLVDESLGGDVIMCEVSAKSRINLDGLLEMILLVAEVGELKANPDRQARGVVVESKLDKSRGTLATLLVQKGTLKAGDNILAGDVVGKVRAMRDDKGKKIRAAGPSTPVEVLGFSEVPPVGETFIVLHDEKDARMVAERQHLKKREAEMHKSSRVSLDDLFKQIEEGEIKDLNLVIKADVQGSAEALIQSLLKLNTDEVHINVIHSGVGAVSESDVMLAAASNALIIGFNIIAPPAARAAAEGENVDIRMYRVIYDCIEDMKKAMTGLLAPEFKERIIGMAEVRQVIRVPKVGVVAGCYISNGKIIRNAQLRVIRNSVVVAEDKVASLRRFKDDAKEVLQGFECGVGLDTFNDIKEGDQLELFVMDEIAREL